MKKELFIEGNSFHINFFYEDSLIAESDLADYQTWLELSVKTLESYTTQEQIQALLGVSANSINLTVSLCGEEEIAEINNDHRGKNKATDVLSFPMQDNVRGGEFDNFIPELELGDVLICKEVCEKQAEEFNITYFEEFIHLLFHGFLHVFGYDHEIDADEEKLMFDLEKSLVELASTLKK